MASIICSSDQRLLTSKRRLKPLMLRDYLLDDLSSCSSNGFKSFPRRQPPPSSSSATVRRLLDAEMKRSGLIQKPRLTRRSRTTCGTAISNAVHKASTAFLNAVKLIPFHATATSLGKGDEKQQGGFSGSFSKRCFWRKPVSQSRREVTVIDVGDGEIQWWRSAAFFPDEESLGQPSDLFSQISTVADEATFSVSEASAITTTVNIVTGDDSLSSGSEFFTNSSSSEIVQSSSSLFSSTSNENDAVEDGDEIGESLNARDCDGSSVNCDSLCNRKEFVNEEKEQLSPVSILECPFEDDDEEDEITGLISHQNADTYEKNARKSRRVNGLVRLEPLELEKRIEKYVEREEEEYSYHVVETEEDESENRANRLFALVKSRIGETNNILAFNVADNLLLDYLQEDSIGAKEETLMVKKVEDWVMDRQEQMFMSWEVREKREVYVKEMKWGCINGDEKENVVEELANGFFTFLVDEFIFDLVL
ncbi:uncharacterized protein LOC103847898 isoform X1 [Brassica rapa]|uniref:DUF4378 domain-containing protein n=1 Tax=Brassica campestris TaxID=3711 RepID=A0A3P5Y0N6_BRACM|nr:uncharacterized protein LOC103847898 isoform X1 [Brassica rapa]XP_033134826.1 uncharacterized protein LOC103847898 isoform X1 [Brassica rapa]CAG7862499.1 unnamed protein product [Brassica rapa]VDC60689.1 unnamed protein product [Brassica rapa]